jgi:exopolysaccharide biosynthesis polyprenyl glycosylphosphotransferase
MDTEWKAAYEEPRHIALARRGGQSYDAVKRLLDIAGAAVGLLLLLPLFAAVALAIKLEDPRGAVFFSQTRVGKDGKTFKMYKFRSMVSNAEELLSQLLDKNEAEGLIFKMKEDPRITKVGRFIRKTSIDELPQLYNVLRGEMSLVGPRPTLPREVKEYNAYHMQRFQVTPGCTGLWQVSGRSSLTFEQMVELDLAYIAGRSLATDLKIIWKTFGAIVGNKDAY